MQTAIGLTGTTGGLIQAIERGGDAMKAVATSSWTPCAGVHRMLALDDRQLVRIVDAAAILPVDKRSTFLERIAGNLERRGRPSAMATSMTWCSARCVVCHFPPPWAVEQREACFVVRDHNVAYVYSEDEPGDRRQNYWSGTRRDGLPQISRNCRSYSAAISWGVRCAKLPDR